MGVTAAELEVILRAKDEMSNVLKDARGNVEQHSKGIMGSLGDMAKTAVGFAMGGALVGGFKAIVGELGSFVTEAANAQKVEAQLDAVLKSTGVAAEAQAQAYANAQGKFMVVGALSAAEQGKLQKSLDETSFSLKQQQARLAEQEAAWAKSKTHTEGAGLAMEATRRKISDLEGNLGGLKAQLAGAGGQTVEMAKALGLTAPAARITKEEILNLANSLSEVTAFEDDTILAGQNMLLTFTAIGKDVFPLATETIMDMATAMGSSDLKGSAIQLGKALQNPIAGVSALAEVGVNFSESQKEVIKSLVESGDVAGAQTLILKELQVEFGGSARAAGETFAGQLKILQNKLGIVKETIGTALLPSLTQLASGLSSTLSNPAVMSAIQGLAAGLSTGLGNAITFVTGAIQTMRPIIDAVVAGMADLWGTLQAGGNLWAALNNGISTFLEKMGASAGVLTGVLDFFYEGEGAISALTTTFKTVTAFVTANLKPILIGLAAALLAIVVPAFVAWATAAGTAAAATVAALAPVLLPIAAIGLAVALLAKAWETNWGDIRGKTKAAMDFISPYIKSTLAAIQTTWNSVFPAMQKLFESVFESVRRVVTTVVPIVQGLIEQLAPVFDKAFKLIQQVVSDVTPVVKRLIEDMAKFVNEQVGKITAWLEENGPLIDAAFAVIVQVIDVALKAIKIIWDTVWPYLQIVIDVVWKAIKNNIDTTINMIMGIIKTVMLLITGDFAGAWEEIQKTAGILLEGLKTLILTILGGIVVAITGKTGDFAQVGLDLVRGLWQGIVDRWNQLKEDVGGLFTGLVSWIRWLLGEHSPSTVMITIGRDLMGGFVIGIEGATPDVISAVAAAIGDILDVFRGLPDLLKGLAAPPAPVDWAIWADAFKDAVEKIMEALFSVYDQPGGVKAGAIVLAKDLAPQIEAILRVFSNLADMLQSVAGLKGDIPDLSGFKRAMTEAITTVLEAVREAIKIGEAGGGNEALLRQVSAMTEDITAVLQLIVPGLEAIAALAVSVPQRISQEQLDSAMQGLVAILNAIATGLAEWAKGAKTAEDLATASALIDPINKVLSVIGPAIAAIEAIASRADVTITDADINGLLDDIAPILATLTFVLSEWARDAAIAANLADASGLVENINKVLSVIGGVISAIDEVAGYGGFKRIEDAQILAILDDLAPILATLTFVLSEWARDANIAASLADSAGIVENINKVLGVITGAIDAIDEVAGYGGFQRIEDAQILAILDDLAPILATLTFVISEWARDATIAANLAASAGIVENINKVLSVVTGAIEAIYAVFNYEGIGVTGLPNRGGAMHGGSALLREHAAAFAADVSAVVEALVSAFTGTISAGAQAFATAAGTVLGVISGGIDAVYAIFGYEGAAVTGMPDRGRGIEGGGAYLRAKATLFAADVVAVVEALSAAFTGTISEGAQAFATAAGTIIGLIAPAIEAITALFKFENIPIPDDAVFDNFVNWFEMVILSIVRVANRFKGTSEQEALGAAQAFAAAVGSVVALVNPAIEAIAALAAFKGIAMPDNDVFDNFVNWFEMVVLAIVRVAGRFAGTSSQEALGAAVTFGAAATSIIALISPAIEAIGKLLDYKAEGLPAAITAFQTDFTSVITGITALAKALTDTGKPQALKFQELAEDIAAAIEAGAAAVGSIQEGGSASAIGAIQAFVTAVTEGLASALTYLEGTFLPAWRSDWAQIAASVDAATASLGKFSTANSNVTSNIDPAIVGKSPPPLAKWMTAIAEATQLAADNMAGLRGRMSRPLAYATTIPARAESAAARVQEVANYALSYIDQRPVGGPADLLWVAELLEWRKRMRR